MISKANQRVGLIKRTFSRLSCKSLKILYKSLVRPILEYCSTIWYPLYKYDIVEIEKVQRRATKLAPSIKELPYEERLKKLNLTTLYYRRNRADVLQVYRIINKIDNLNFDDFFVLNPRNRGHKYKLEKPRANIAIRANSFSHRVIDMWNELKSETVEAPSINSFKNRLEKEWRNDPHKFSIENL